jgi:hypothetical protein
MIYSIFLGNGLPEAAAWLSAAWLPGIATAILEMFQF